MTTIEVLRQRKREAEAALHALVTGENAVLVWVDGVTRTQFQEIDAAKLEAYIARLEREIAAAEATGAGELGARPRRVFRATF